MSNQPRKRSRKKYLEPNEAFIVPSSTRHFRSRLARTPDETAEEHQASTTDCENESTINVTGAVAAEATEDGAGSSEGGPQFGEVGSNGTQPDNWDDGLLDDTPQEDSTVDAAEIVACCFESLQHAILPISNISKAEVLAMVMTFVTSENLTWSGLDKLLLMINRICGMEVLPRTKYLFRKLLASKLKRSTDYYYCEFCEGFLPTPEDGTSTIICTTCQKRTTISELRSKGNFFTILDVSDQVRQVVSKTSDELYSNLERLNSNPEDTMSDITDGRAHQIEERTHELVLRDMKYAVTYDTTVNGFKGPSPLINLENYDMVSGQACEYMHSVLLGVTKQLTEHLLDSSNSAERFYIGSPQSLESANKLLMSIRPPHCITRLPRSLSSASPVCAPGSSIPCKATRPTKAVGPASYGTNKSLTLWYTNCRSVKNKVTDLRMTVAALPPNAVVLLTESWLDPGVNDAKKTYKDILIMGDFNAHIDWWGHDEAVPGDRVDDLLLDAMSSAGLYQVCRAPTHTSNDGNTSFLDLAFVSDIVKVGACDVSPGLTGSDHSAIELTYFITLPRTGRIARTFWNYANTDHDHMSQLAHLVPWCITTSGSDCVSNYDLWCDLVAAIQQECVPSTSSSARRKRSPWMTTDLLKMARRKRTLFKKAARMHCPVLFQEAKQLQRRLKTAIYVAFTNYSRIIAGKIKDDPQLFWAFISRQRSTPHKPCLLSGDCRVTAPRDIAQLFATQFSSFSPDDLQSAIERLKSSRSVGPDHLAPTFLKLLYPLISHPLLNMLQSFADNAFVPDTWKRAFISPIHKGRGKSTHSACNYRPVSITSILCRTFERMINTRFLTGRTHQVLFQGSLARVGLTCRLLDGSLKGTYLATIPRINKRSGQPELIRARTKHHSSSPILAGIEDFISAPLRIRSPLPQDRTESAAQNVSQRVRDVNGTCVCVRVERPGLTAENLGYDSFLTTTRRTQLQSTWRSHLLSWRREREKTDPYIRRGPGSSRTCGLSPASNNWLAAVGIGPCDIVLHLRVSVWTLL
ncbi:hypothetical protein HPB47_025289 [Ixodes persulcatus]|uniref:Uncharacterized protein n=1 Tax=Ixodes persulcatus TaxID=34615 RepID=A0AC60Q292_IXOPE|nr:hypothetical protein HPB47_025289 [Ixodes persulcatus]